MRPGTLLIAGVLATALLTSCDRSTDTDCESAALHPSPVAQAAPVAPDKPRPRPKTSKPKTIKPKTTVTPKPKLRHHDFDLDTCDDD
ncbi:hypothetical protein [Streptomyces sp. NPDC047042]|uniref:hypothetical protein n=1 Tax=Streptomyces sp. NPDC047042 TaxID=3154807 RepID=UPI0033EA2033